MHTARGHPLGQAGVRERAGAAGQRLPRTGHADRSGVDKFSPRAECSRVHHAPGRPLLDPVGMAALPNQAPTMVREAAPQI